MKEYLGGLVAELQQSLAAGGAEHPIRLKAQPIKLNPDKAVSLGVVVAELVTNAFKYAYPDGRSGEVRVAFSAAPADHLRLTVEDDGAGLGDKVVTRGTGLGQRVIAAMARSLNSRVEYDPSHNGARAVLAFQA